MIAFGGGIMLFGEKNISRGIWAYILFFIGLEPAIFQHLNGIDSIFDILQMVAFGLVVLILGVRRRLPKSHICEMLVMYYLYLLGVTIVNHGAVKSVLIQGVHFIWFSYYLCIVLNNNPKELFRSGLNILTFYVIANCITLFVFPEGLYATGYYSSNFILGYDNQNVNFLLPAMVLVLIKNMYIKRSSKQVIVIYLASLITAFKIWSGMTIVVISVMTLIAVGLYKPNSFLDRYMLNGKVFSFGKLLVANVSLFVGLVFFRIQYFFEYFIVIILKKNLTLTSRVTIWARNVDKIKQNWLWGYGRESYGTRAARLGFRAESPAALHAHNRFLETQYRGGAILSSIYFGMLVYTAKCLFPIRETAIAKVLSWGIFIYICGMLTEFYDYCIFLWGFMVIAENAKQIIDFGKAKLTINNENIG